MIEETFLSSPEDIDGFSYKTLEEYFQLFRDARVFGSATDSEKLRLSVMPHYADRRRKLYDLNYLQRVMQVCERNVEGMVLGTLHPRRDEILIATLLTAVFHRIYIGPRVTDNCFHSSNLAYLFLEQSQYRDSQRVSADVGHVDWATTPFVGKFAGESAVDIAGIVRVAAWEQLELMAEPFDPELWVSAARKDLNIDRARLAKLLHRCTFHLDVQTMGKVKAILSILKIDDKA